MENRRYLARIWTIRDECDATIVIGVTAAAAAATGAIVPISGSTEVNVTASIVVSIPGGRFRTLFSDEI